ncbi:MAG: hypothetical protein CL953_00125 [Erythrobacteraceae bacterium]|nr:hypothetical protein [Erythrobacteraceae bacterium]
MYTRIVAASLAALAVVACGEAEAPAEAETASLDQAASGTGMDSGAPATAEPVAAEKRKALTPIPAAFHGKWGMLGDCSDPMVITAGGIESSGAPPLKSVKILDKNVIELDREPDPEYPDQDQRFGLSVQSEDMLILSAPKMSSLRLERCGTRPAREQATASAAGGLPAKFRGRWDESEFGDCSGSAPDAVTVEADRISDQYEGGWRLANIERLDANTYRAMATYISSGKTFRMTLKLQDAGEKLTLDMGDQSSIVYDMRCG